MKDLIKGAKARTGRPEYCIMTARMVVKRLVCGSDADY